MFESTKPKTPLFAALLVLPLLAGFDIADPSQASTSHDHETMILSKVMPQESHHVLFGDALSHAYKRLAVNHSKDWRATEHFTKKALSSQNFNIPLPEYLDEWHLLQEQSLILSQARARLVTALSNAVNSGRAPIMAIHSANAQAYFDCWVASSEYAWHTPQGSTCQMNFDNAISELELQISMSERTDFALK